MAITTYSDISAAGLVAGALYKSIVNGTKITGVNAGAVVMAAGFGAVWSGTRNGATLPSGAGNYAGVIVLPYSVEVRAAGSTHASVDAGGRFGYPIDFEVALANTDQYVVWVDDTVAVGDPVYLNHTASTSVVGAYRNDANSSNAQLITGAKFVSAATGTNSVLALAVVDFSAK
jgi:hypothetical protein